MTDEDTKEYFRSLAVQREQMKKNLEFNVRVGKQAEHNLELLERIEKGE